MCCVLARNILKRNNRLLSLLKLTKMMKWKIISFIFLISLTHTPAQEILPVDIHPLIAKNLSAYDTLSCMLVMREQMKYTSIPLALSKSDKTTTIYQNLSEVATNTQHRLLDSLTSWGIPHHSFYIVNAIQARLDSKTLEKLRNNPDLSSILPDFPLTTPPQFPEPGTVRRLDTLLNWGISHIRADSVWRTGITGKGVVVAGLDTGTEWDHDFLIQNYRGSQKNGVVDHSYNWHDGINKVNSLHFGKTDETSMNPCGFSSTTPCDDHGHGTFTIGLVTGVYDQQHTGIAPGTQWISSRVMESGAGHLSTYLDGLEWCLAPTNSLDQSPRPDLAPDIINNSWACPYQEGCIPANYWMLDSATSRLTQGGIFVVTSAGNSGREGCSSLMDPPAIFPSNFTIGATGRKDSITDFSSRGPIDSSGLIKPEVVAPGQGITSIYPNNAFQKSSGTSISAPITAGVAALILEANPTLRGRPDLLRKIIIESAIPIKENPCGEPGYPNSVYGYGRIDALNAVQLAQQFQPTSTSDKNLPDLTFQAFPNPIQDIVQFVNHTEVPSQAHIYDAQGRLVKAFRLHGNESRKIDISNLRSGIYFARFSTSRGVIVLKIMKI